MKKYIEVQHLDEVKSSDEFYRISETLSKNVLYIFKDETEWEMLAVFKRTGLQQWDIHALSAKGETITLQKLCDIPEVIELQKRINGLYSQLGISAELNAQTENLLLKAFAVASNPSKFLSGESECL